MSTKTERYIYKLNMTGDISSKSQRHGPSPQMSEFEELTILEMLLEKPSMYLNKNYCASQGPGMIVPPFAVLSKDLE